MNAEQIRAQYVEVLAWTLLELDDPYAEQSTDNWRAEYHPRAVPFVDALAAAGLLPSIVEEVESGVWGTDRFDRRRVRYLTEWQEVTE